MAKQTTITIETKSLMIFRSQSSKRVWCPACDTETDVIAVKPTGLSTPEATALERWLRTGGVHRAEAADGSWLICLTSLLDRVQNTNPDRDISRLLGSEKERR